MSLSSDLTAIKNLSDGVKNNKVTRFAYTQNAYNNNDVNGHSDYVYDRDNNIPTADLSVIEVNQTVVDKGFRARASSLTRMLLNHLFGRISYNLNKVNDLFNELLVKVMANMGVANGFATLDASGRIPYSQLPEDAMEYQGEWNAQTNTPHLADGTGTRGDTYNVSVAGTQNLGSGSITFFVGDRVIYNENGVWQRLESGNVQSVCDILPDQTTGNVDLTQQSDVTKVLNSDFLAKLFKATLGWKWEAGQNVKLAQILTYPDYLLAYMYSGTGEGNPQGRLVKSTDGKTWSLIANDVNILIQVSPEIIFAGNSETASNIYVSTDSGRNFSRWGTRTEVLHDVCHYYNDRYLFATGRGLLVGIPAEPVGTEPITSTVMYYLKKGGSFDYIVAGSSGALYYLEPNPSNTVHQTNVTSDWNPYFIACAGGKFITGNRRADGAKYSVDGRQWYNCTGDVTSRKLYFAKYVNGIWVGATNSGVVYSSDGISWTRASLTTGDCLTLDYINGLFIAGCGGRPWWSEDGINWYQGTLDINDGFGANTSLTYSSFFSHYADIFCSQVTYVENTFFAVGYRCIWSSPNGKTWFKETDTASSSHYDYMAISKLNNQVVAGAISSSITKVGKLIRLSDVVAQIDGE